MAGGCFILIVALLVFTIFAIVFVQQGRRNVPVLFPGRRVGNRMSMPVRSNLPLMVNMAGMIPLIFAQSFLTFPAIIAIYFINSDITWVANFATGIYNAFSGQGPFYALIYFILVVAFTFFYTDVLFQQQNYGENLKKPGSPDSGCDRGRGDPEIPDQGTAAHHLPGSVLPWVLWLCCRTCCGLILPAASSSTVFLVSAAGLLIVVGVVRDTFTIIETELKLHGYEESLIQGWMMGMYIVLLGPPGAGKGTQAEVISEKLGLVHVSSGDLFRENLKNETELGKLAQGYMNRGELVPDDVTIAMVKARLMRADSISGALLDGFPRTPAQAKRWEKCFRE